MEKRSRLWITSFIDHVYLVCTQCECKPNQTVIEEYTNMFESRTSARATEKLPGWEEPHAKTIAWSWDMEGHAKKCVERYSELTNKNVEQLHKVSSPCLDDHQFKKKNLNQWENYLKYAHRFPNWTTCFYGLSINWIVQLANGLRHATEY